MHPKRTPIPCISSNYVGLGFAHIPSWCPQSNDHTEFSSARLPVFLIDMSIDKQGINEISGKAL